MNVIGYACHFSNESACKQKRINLYWNYNVGTTETAVNVKRFYMFTDLYFSEYRNKSKKTNNV